MKTNILLTVTALIFYSCSSRINTHNQVHKFISPESNGGNFQGTVGVFGGNNIESVIDLDQNTTEIERESEQDQEIVMNPTLGVLPGLDIITNIAVSGMVGYSTTRASMGGLKYQLLGADQNSASKGNHALSIYGMYGQGENTQTNDEDLELTAVDEEAKVDLELINSTAGIVYGYRASEKLLLSLGMSYDTMSFEGEIESDNATLDGQEIDYSSYAVGYQIGLDLWFNKHNALKLEAAYMDNKYNESSHEIYRYFGIGYVFAWH